MFFSICNIIILNKLKKVCCYNNEEKIMKNCKKVLIESKLFNRIKETEINDMMKCLSPIKKEYEKNEYIYRYGENIKFMGFVVQGSVHIIKEDYWGNRTIISEISEGEIFGEAYACSEKRILSVNVVAAQNVSILYISIDKILKVCSSCCVHHTILIQNLINILADKNINLTNKIEYMSQRKLRDKILSYLSDISEKQKSSEFTISFSRQELADYLSVDRSALSNQLCKLRDEGILDFNKNHFKLKRETKKKK